MLQDALASLFSYIEASVIDTNRSEYLSSVHRRCCEIFNRTVNERDLTVEPCVILTFKEKILHTFLTG